MSRYLQAVAVALGLCAAAATAAQPRVPAASAFQVRSVEVPAGPSATVRVDIIAFSPTGTELRVLPPAAFDPGMAQAGRGLSVAAAVAPLERRIAPAQAAELLIVNGGFSGGRTDLPVGLLVSDGRVASTMDRQLRHGDPADSCAARRVDRLRYSALLCAAPGRVDIRSASADLDLRECRNALQAAPLMVEDGKSAICPDETAGRAYLRTVLCRSGDQVQVVVTSAPIHLYPLAAWMARPAAAGGLGCRQAMNLSGDSSTGAVLLTARGSASRQRRDFGPGSFPLPSLIVVQPRLEPGRAQR